MVILTCSDCLLELKVIPDSSIDAVSLHSGSDSDSTVSNSTRDIFR